MIAELDAYRVRFDVQVAHAIVERIGLERALRGLALALATVESAEAQGLSFYPRRRVFLRRRIRAQAAWWRAELDRRAELLYTVARAHSEGR